MKERQGDQGTGGRGDKKEIERATLGLRFAPSPRPLVPPSLLHPSALILVLRVPCKLQRRDSCGCCTMQRRVGVRPRRAGRVISRCAEPNKEHAVCGRSLGARRSRQLSLLPSKTFARPPLKRLHSRLKEKIRCGRRETRVKGFDSACVESWNVACSDGR